MTQSILPSGVIGPTGPTGPTGPAGPTGPGGGAHLETTLASSTAVGDSSLTLTSAQANVTAGLGFVMIDRFTTNAEFRKVVTVSGTAVTVGPSVLTKAHAVGAEVVFFQGGAVPANWFGAKGDNSTNDEPALQWALTETARQGVWLEGENRAYRCSLPIAFPGSGKMRHLNLHAMTGAGGLVGDPNGAFVMGQQGQVRTFTGDAGTNLVTITDGVHGMGSASPFTSHHGIPVLFKGSSLPGGITAGKVYYGYATSTTVMRVASNRASGSGTATSGSNVLTGVTTRTVQAFTVGMAVSDQGGTIPQGTTITAVTSTTVTMSANATASGSATVMAGDLVDITSNGSGTIYCELMSMARIYLDDVLIQGFSVANLNGVAATLQQPGFMRKLRIDNCPGTGLTVAGQQYIWENLEIIGCGTGIAFEDMSMAWFFGTNVEGPTARAVHLRAKSQIFQSTGGGKAHFSGWHDELNTVSDSIAFDLESGVGLLIQDAQSSNSLATQKFIHAGPAYAGSYTVDNCYFSGGNPGGPTLVHDEFRGHNILVWDASAPSDNRRYVNRWDAGSYAGDAYPNRHPVRMLRLGGGYLGWGGQGNGVESWQSRPGSGQTAPQSEWLDKSGNRATTVNKDGYLTTMKTSAPADADLAANQAFFWLDTTAGAPALKVKMKDSAGTVFTRTLST